MPTMNEGDKIQSQSETNENGRGKTRNQLTSTTILGGRQQDQGMQTEDEKEDTHSLLQTKRENTESSDNARVQ